MAHSSRQKIISANRAVDIADRARRAGQSVVTTNGCFDILHVGHVNYLEQAKKLGDILIVAVNADESVKENKGDRRPIVPAPERARMLASLEAVDHVFVFKEKTPHKWLEKIRPDIHVKGGDFRPRQLPEYPVIRSFGGKVKTIGLVKSRSTTDIIKKVLDVYKKTPPKAGTKN